MTIATGTAALVVEVPGVPAVVGELRRLHDPAAARGMPAHITVMFPFLDVDRLGASDLADLAAVCRSVPARSMRIDATGRFPGVLFLRPSPSAWLVELTGAITARWPDALPYGGEHDEVVPHLTVAIDADETLLDGLDRTVSAALPFEARIDEAQLYLFDGDRWVATERMALGPSSSWA